MALYGSVGRVQNILQATEDDAFADANKTSWSSWLATVSAYIESETRRVWGDSTPVPTTKVVPVSPANATLFLPIGLRSVTSIVIAPTWDGTGWDGGTTLVDADYRLSGLTADGVYRRILGINYAFGGDVVITGIWEDQADTVPEAIHHIASYMAAELFKKQQASPAGFTGPDGATVPLRDVFTQSEVQKTLDLYRAGRGYWAL